MKKPFNPLPIFTVGKMESSTCICGPKSAVISNFGPFEPQNMKKIPIFFSYKNGGMLPRTHIESMNVSACFSSVEPEDLCEAQTLQLY